MKSLRTASIESDPSIVLLPDRCLAVSYNGFSVDSVVEREQQGDKNPQNDLSDSESSLDSASNHSGTGTREQLSQLDNSSADDSCGNVLVADELTM